MARKKTPEVIIADEVEPIVDAVVETPTEEVVEVVAEPTEVVEEVSVDATAVQVVPLSAKNKCRQ